MVHAPKRIPRKIVYRSLKKLNEENFKSDIQNAPFSVAHIFDECEDIAWFHEKLFSEIIES